MASVDTLIQNAEIRSASYASTTGFLVGELMNLVRAYDPTIITGVELDLTHADLPAYVAPVKDAVAMPVYEPPLSILPSAPELTGISPITLPPDRTIPIIATAGLFAQVAPSSNLPDFNEAAPDMQIDALVAEMNALALPSIQAIDMPVLTPFSIGSAPILNIPVYDAPPVPDAIRDPVDYATAMDSTYNRMLPEMQAFIDDKMSLWIAQYAPEYQPWLTQLQAKVSTGMDGGILPDQFEAGMFNRAQGRTEREFTAAEDSYLESFAKSGFIAPPGAMLSARFIARLKGADALANQATDIYIERRKTEIQHVQLVMGLASAQIQSVRGTAIAYAGVLGNTMQQAVGYANSIAEKLEKVFDHLLARAELSISVLKVVGEQYEIQLKSALSALDGYKLELEAEKMKKDIEMSQIKLVEANIAVQELAVKRFSAVIEAVARKGQIEELKMKGYSIRADVFKTQTQAKVAGFEVYKAAIEGDRAKLQGELAKLTAFESQINIDTLRLDSQIKGMEAVTTSNNAKIEVFKSGAEVYKLDVEAALQKFTAYADVKKLAQSVYSTELNNAIDSFKANLEIPKIMLEALIKEYELKVQTALKEAEIDVQKLQISEQAAAASVSAYQSMASSALGSLNTVASSAISASA